LNKRLFNATDVQEITLFSIYYATLMMMNNKSWPKLNQINSLNILTSKLECPALQQCNKYSHFSMQKAGSGYVWKLDHLLRKDMHQIVSHIAARW